MSRALIKLLLAVVLLAGAMIYLSTMDTQKEVKTIEIPVAEEQLAK